MSIGVATWKQSINGRMVDVHASIELQEQLQAFMGGDRVRTQEIGDVITGIEERVNTLRRSRDDAWEVISGRMTSEVDRVSATLNEQVAEVEHVVQTRRTSRATTVAQNLTIHEDITRLDSRIEAGFMAFSREVDELREETTQSIEGQDRNLKEWTRSKITTVATQLKGLREFAIAVEQLIHKKFPPQESGASALGYSLSQGCTEGLQRTKICQALDR